MLKVSFFPFPSHVLQCYPSRTSLGLGPSCQPHSSWQTSSVWLDFSLETLLVAFPPVALEKWLIFFSICCGTILCQQILALLIFITSLEVESLKCVFIEHLLQDKTCGNRAANNKNMDSAHRQLTFS